MNKRQVAALDLLLDDHFALWDFADSFPDFRPGSEGGAIQELIELVRQNFIVVEFGRWFENRTQQVTAAEAERALLDPFNWNATGLNPGYLLVLTDMGEKQLKSLWKS